MQLKRAKRNILFETSYLKSDCSKCKLLPEFPATDINHVSLNLSYEPYFLTIQVTAGSYGMYYTMNHRHIRLSTSSKHKKTENISNFQYSQYGKLNMHDTPTPTFTNNLTNYLTTTFQ